MVKQTVVHAYHEMLLINNNKKELVTYTYKNLDESPLLSQGIPKGYTVYTNPFI